jgi:hypothetical protein
VQPRPSGGIAGTENQKKKKKKKEIALLVCELIVIMHHMHGVRGQARKIKKKLAVGGEV